MKNLFTLLGLALIIGLTSCTTQKVIDQNVSILGQKTWTLNTIDGRSIDAKDYREGSPYLNFLPEMKITGSTGCNELKSNYSYDKKGFDFLTTATTKKACDGNGESMFLSALDRVEKAKIENDKLVFLDDKKDEVMTFLPRR